MQLQTSGFRRFLAGRCDLGFDLFLADLGTDLLLSGHGLSAEPNPLHWNGYLAAGSLVGRRTAARGHEPATPKPRWIRHHRHGRGVTGWQRRNERMRAPTSQGTENPQGIHGAGSSLLKSPGIDLSGEVNPQGRRDLTNGDGADPRPAVRSAAPTFHPAIGFVNPWSYLVNSGGTVVTSLLP